MGVWGWLELEDGLLGLLLGFGLMIGFYLCAGMGAGDVRALAALGAWLGPWDTFRLFIFMGLSGLPLVILLLWYRGQLVTKLHKIWHYIANLALTRSKVPANPGMTSISPQESMPYAVAIALGMVLLGLSAAN